jgi:hypothetical protein
MAYTDTYRKPTFTIRPWLEEVLKADPDHYKKDIVYQFSNDRQFVSTDDTDSGVYDGH